MAHGFHLHLLSLSTRLSSCVSLIHAYVSSALTKSVTLDAVFKAPALQTVDHLLGRAGGSEVRGAELDRGPRPPA
jgi:hypothetical protein